MLTHQISSKTKALFSTLPGKIIGYLCLSWLYAIASQIIIPLPFNLVPISLQPVPLLLATFAFGWHAVGAYAVYLFQGAMGLPFFAGMQGGLLRLLGPTGGYLIGFGLAMALVAWMGRKLHPLAILMICNTIIFSCGLAQLAFFVPASKLLAAGLIPFILGDFFIKPAIILLVMRRRL
jgi:biotin transport system substrate-specific component